MRSTRREFLKLIGALITTAGAQTIFGENALSENSIIGGANVLPWSGDDFILDYPYQSFADEPYPFCQMVMAESPYMISGRYKPDMGSVLTVYHPFKGGALGRDRLLSLNREEFASSLVSQLSTLMEPFQNNLECIDVTRWGHAICVPKPGLATAIDEVNHHSIEWISYAHSTAGGGQAFGGAYSAARRAADRCLKGRFGS